jgi:hypothetical protein
LLTTLTAIIATATLGGSWFAWWQDDEYRARYFRLFADDSFNVLPISWPRAASTAARP